MINFYCRYCVIFRFSLFNELLAGLLRDVLKP
jgi:hypothetical protein